MDLDTNVSIIVSLGMAGRLQYTQGNHSHVCFEISDCQVTGPFRVMKHVFNLYYEDPRYMGGVDIIPNHGLSLYFKDQGPCLLQASLDEQTWISLERWIQIFAQKKFENRMICDILLEQSLVAGIGNYLRAEILYYSGINPTRKVQSITLDEWDRIRSSSHKVINLAYQHNGFTIESFISPDGTYGTYPAAVYGKTHDPTGNPVVKTDVKDRKIHWVPAIQL
jgi:formamidopyrimidine-DNA glycosylase